MFATDLSGRRFIMFRTISIGKVTKPEVRLPSFVLLLHDATRMLSAPVVVLASLHELSIVLEIDEDWYMYGGKHLPPEVETSSKRGTWSGRTYPYPSTILQKLDKRASILCQSVHHRLANESSSL